MKKILVSLLALAALATAADVSAVENRFANGCQLTYSGINTSGQEKGLSLYKRKQIIFFRNDTAFVVAMSDDSDLDPFFVAKELKNIPVHDQFAYDDHYDQIIFSWRGKLFQSFWVENNWTSQRTVRMQGVTGRIHGDYTDTVANPHEIRHLYNPTFAYNGDRLYFSAVSQSRTDRDIWYAERGGVNGRWQAPHKLAGNVNTSANEDHPFVVGDTLLYFVSDRDSVRNLYYVDLRDIVPMAKLSVLSNPKTNENGIVVVENHVHIISDRCPNNPDERCDDNIYKAVLPDKPLPADYVSFVPDDEADSAGAEPMPVIFQPLTEAEADSALAANTPAVAEQSSTAASSEPSAQNNAAKRTKAASAQDQAKADSVLRRAIASAPENVKAVKISKNVATVADKLIFYFDTDKDTLRNEYAQDFETLAKRLAENDDRYIIIGFTDERGTAAYNSDLSVRRAQRVFEELVGKGIESRRLMFTGFGSRALVVKHAKTEAEHQLNRRVEIHRMK